MAVRSVTHRPADIRRRPASHRDALLPGLLGVALMIVWAAHDGGYDADTWYWGALAGLALLIGSVIALSPPRRRLTGWSRACLAAFVLYATWSYASILWAQSPGLALEGSNRALLYLIVFALFTILPWTAESAMTALLAFALGVGVISLVLVFRLAALDGVQTLVGQGRLAAPTGYFNGTAALFSMQALVAIGLAARREMPALGRRMAAGAVRGLLLATAGASLELAVVVQSRGWLFTLPVITLFALLLVRDRIRLAAAGALPVLAAVVPIHRLLAIYDDAGGPHLASAAARAGRQSLVLLAAVFVLGTVLAWFDGLPRRAILRPQGRRVLGAAFAAIALAGGAAGALAVSHGHPVAFISRQWHGFSHEQTTTAASHFSDVGSGRYDFWRVAWNAFVTHPLGGLGQDNFRAYYLPRRHTPEEPAWTHSLELRLLAHTGAVGFLLFAGWLLCGLAAVIRARRRGIPPQVAATVGIALLPLVVWLVYGSIDWFWEIPALSGPAIGFFGIALALAAQSELPTAGRRQETGPGPAAKPARWPARSAWSAWSARAGWAAAALTAGAAVIALAFPYLSVREVSIGSDLGPSQPIAALEHLATAADLNPLSLDPERLAGTIALRIGDDGIAVQRFYAALRRDPGDWFSWLGAGLADSSLGRAGRAAGEYRAARAINRQQPAVTAALARVFSRHPLSVAEAFRMLILPG